MIARGRPGQGRRRLPSGQRRPALPRPADARARDAARGAWRCSPSTASSSRARTRSWSGAATSSASRSRCSCCSANATVTICHSRTRDLARAHARRRHPRRRGRACRASSRPTWSSRARPSSTSASTAPTTGLVGDVDPRRRRGRGPHDAGPGRRRADDDRDAAAQHGASRAATAAACLRSRRSELTFAPLHQWSAARCPGRRCLCKEEVRWLRAPSSGSRTRRATGSSSAKAARTCSSTSRRSRWTATSR